MNDSKDSLKNKFSNGLEKAKVDQAPTQEETFLKYKKKFIDSYAGEPMSISERSKLSFQISVSASQSFFNQKDKLTMVDHKEGILVRLIYNLSNKVKPSEILNYVGIADGITYRATEFLGGDEFAFSHVKVASSGAITGCKVRATIWIYKIVKEETQLKDDLTHSKYFDTFLDPYCDFTSAKRILGTPGRSGELGEYDDLKIRKFNEPTDKKSFKHLQTLASFLKRAESDGIKFLKDKLSIKD